MCYICVSSISHRQELAVRTAQLLGSTCLQGSTKITFYAAIIWVGIMQIGKIRHDTNGFERQKAYLPLATEVLTYVAETILLVALATKLLATFRPALNPPHETGW